MERLYQILLKDARDHDWQPPGVSLQSLAQIWGRRPIAIQRLVRAINSVGAHAGVTIATVRVPSGDDDHGSDSAGDASTSEVRYRFSPRTIALLLRRR